MRILAAALALSVAATALAADRAEEVRQTEVAFAKAFADRDQVRFWTFVADDAIFLGSKRTMNGKPEIITAWSVYFKDAKAPFSWSPARVFVNKKGDLGLSTGPVLDENGKHILDYTSTWQRQRNGKWKIVFDGPGGTVCE
jgi:ketosteroid isomerase-like protein